MTGIGGKRLTELKDEFAKVCKVLEVCQAVPKDLAVPTEEFVRRQKAVYEAIAARGFDVGFVFSDEHYDGDVPYLGGNTNITIEQVAGLIGKTGFHVVAGLEGGYVSEQLAPRARAIVHKVEILQLADEKYPIDAERLEDVMEAAVGGKARRVALLSPRQVVPDAIVGALERAVGTENVVDAQDIYYKAKYIKSDTEMALIRDANMIGDAMVMAMLAVLRPGLLETEIASWGYWVGKQLGSEENGWDVMVTSGEANRTLIGKALNKPVSEGDYVHIGVAPKRDGLNACVRRSVIAVDGPKKVTADQRFWFDFVAEAYEVGDKAYRKVAAEGLPAKLQEQALQDYFASRAAEVSRRIGREVNLARQKPYTGTHNAGYTECQEFYGAITLDSNEPLGHQIVTMLDVAIRGIGNHWDDVIIPGLDYVVIENTLGKFGTRVETFNRLPNDVQPLVGRGY
jgi:Xaa-Pro aminopeptidase